MTATAASPLSEEERAGKKLFLEGVGASGEEISARVGASNTPVPGPVVACGNCHGPDGLGRLEGGVTAPAVTWSELTKSYGHTHADGRRHPPFTEDSLRVALLDGRDPAGNRLDPAMPRYAIGRDDLRRLIAYLKRLETDRDPGVGDASLRVGTLLPASAQAAEIAAVTERVLRAYFDDINARGGIYGRRLELLTAETGATPEATAENIKRLVVDKGVFALVAPFTAGAEAPMAAWAEERRVPVIGPVTPRGHPGAAINRYTFYVLGGLSEQSAVLADFAAQAVPPPAGTLAAVYLDEDGNDAVVQNFKAHATERGIGQVVEIGYPAGRLDAEVVIQRLASAHPKALLFLGPEQDLDALLRRAASERWYPHVLLPAAVGGRAASGAPDGFDGRVLLAYPWLPTDFGPPGAEIFADFRARHKLNAAPLVPQVSAYTSAMLLAEGLRRAGRQLSREKLIAALETVQDFHTGLVPPLSYNAGRRVGAIGAHVVAFDAKNRSFRPVAPWRQ